MTTVSAASLQTSTVPADWRQRVVPAILAAAVGAVLLYAAGFAHVEAVHEAAHDVRHSAAMPCH